MERALNLRNIVLDNSNIKMINQNNQNNQNVITSERTSYIDDTVMRERVMNFRITITNHV